MHALRTYAVLGLLTVGAIGFAIVSGVGSVFDPEVGETLLRLRLTRIGAAFAAGACLSAGGVAVQGLFRNPLASPSILGTTAGANLGGQLALLAAPAFVAQGPLPHDIVLALGCFVGALLALLILLAFLRAGADLLTLLLIGFILSSLFLSVGSFLMSLAQTSWELGRAMVAWTLGSVGGTGHRHMLLSVPLVGAGVGALWGWGRSLDLMLSGEEEASALGVDVAATRLWTVVWVALLTAVAVSLGGGVAFVGLIVPHALRPFLGPSHRALVPAAAMLGGGFLVFCDAVSRLFPTHSEVPLGVVTGLIGAPIFLWILVRRQREAFDG